MFPERKLEGGAQEVPKTLIFAKTDSHADDIIQIVREEFAAGNAFCKKITYRIDEDPQSVLNSFRNDYNPRVAVTVDMIATGTDVKPIECLLFMRDVKSRNYYMQMIRRGTRSLDADGLKMVNRSARGPKTHFVLVDAVGVSRSEKMDTGSLERKPAESTKNLMQAVTMGVRDEATLSTLAARLCRHPRQPGADHVRRAALQEPRGARRSLYFVIKDHPFSDGNKRCGAFLLLLYLRQEGMRLTLNDNGLTALALLVAESEAGAKPLMIRLITHLLSDAPAEPLHQK